MHPRHSPGRTKNQFVRAIWAGAIMYSEKTLDRLTVTQRSRWRSFLWSCLLRQRLFCCFLCRRLPGSGLLSGRLFWGGFFSLDLFCHDFICFGYGEIKILVLPGGPAGFPLLSYPLAVMVMYAPVVFPAGSSAGKYVVVTLVVSL